MDITYKEFINNILETRGRFNCGDEYHERHHIIPRCMSGTDDKENLIDLFAREHFEAHRLLALENPDNAKIVYAWWMMSTTMKANKKRGTITSEEYEEAKKILSQTISGANNPMYGKPSPRLGSSLSEDQKQHLREINLGELNPNYGKTVSDATREKMRIARLGKVATDEARLNMSKAHIGKNMGADSSVAKPLAQYDLDGFLIQIWDCAADVQRCLNINAKSIYDVCNGRCKSAGGYQFRYINGDVPKQIPKYTNECGKYQIKLIARCDDDWNIIDIWNGATDAQNGTGINRVHIGSCCSGKRQHAGGYRWKILDENYE